MENSTLTSRKRSGRKPSRLRRLVEKVVDSAENPADTKPKRVPWCTVLAILLAASLIIFCCLNETPIMEFTACYRRQYNEIIHGSCSREIDTTTLFKKISENNILHQKDALDKIKQAFHNTSRLLSLALVGPPGVGKTLFASALVDNFPWHKNALRYAWNTYVNDELEKFQMLRYFLNSLSECGRNLLIIDNLVPCDKEIVPLVQEMFEQMQVEWQQNKEQDEKYLIVIFVFSLNTMIDAEAYAKTREILQILPNTTTINFRSFEEPDVEDCIKRELTLENMILTENNFKQVSISISPKLSGCKNVLAKVLLYGTAGTEMAVEDSGDIPEAKQKT